MPASERQIFRLRLLGGLWIESNGTIWTVLSSHRKALALLAVLAAAGERGLSRDKLFALLWPESDASQSRNALSQILFRLRRELGQDAILGNGDLRLNAARITSDIADLDEANLRGVPDRVANLYSGQFLDGFYVREAPEFERWVDAERHRLERIYFATLESLASEASARGRHVESAEWWRRRMTAEPLSARVARAYIEALAAAGDREAAIRFSSTYSALVRSELGTDPDPEITRLADRINRSSLPIESPVRDDRELSSPAVLAEPTNAARIVQGRRRRSWPIAAGVATAVAIAVGAAILLRRPSPPANLVVVVPFTNATGDSTLDALGTVLSTATSNGIASTGVFQVVDPQVVLATDPRVTGKDPHRMSIRDAARGSGAALLVSGNIQRHADSIIVVASIFRHTGAIVGSTEPIAVAQGHEDLLIQGLRQRIVGGLVAIGDKGRAHWNATESSLPQYEAQVEYARALDALVDEQLRPALQHCLKAMAIDSQFVAPQILALTTDPPDSIWAAVTSSLEARRAALSIPEQLSLDGWEARRRGDLEGFYRAAKRRLSYAPDEPDGLLVAAYAALVTNRFEEAIQSIHRLGDHGGWVSDLGPRWWRDFEAHHMLGDFKGALREWEAARRLHPDDPYICAKGVGQLAAMGNGGAVLELAAQCERLPGAPNIAVSLLDGSRELLAHGFVAEAHRVLAQALARESDTTNRKLGPNLRSNFYFMSADWPHAYEAYKARVRSDGVQGPDIKFAIAAAKIGDTTVVTRLIGRLSAHPTDSLYLVQRAALLLALGRRNDALIALESAVSSNAPVYAIHANVDLLPLRDEPRFQALLAPRP